MAFNLWYLLLGGNLPLIQTNLMAFNEFIISRPNEWGLSAPEAKARLYDIQSYNWQAQIYTLDFTTDSIH